MLTPKQEHRKIALRKTSADEGLQLKVLANS
jgi:hypothetical protein